LTIKERSYINLKLKVTRILRKHGFVPTLATFYHIHNTLQVASK